MKILKSIRRLQLFWILVILYLIVLGKQISSHTGISFILVAQYSVLVPFLN